MASKCLTESVSMFESAFFLVEDTYKKASGGGGDEVDGGVVNDDIVLGNLVIMRFL